MLYDYMFLIWHFKFYLYDIQRNWISILLEKIEHFQYVWIYFPIFHIFDWLCIFVIDIERCLRLNNRPSTHVKDALCQVWMVIEKKIFKFRQCIFAISIFYPLGKGYDSSIEQLWIPSTKVVYTLEDMWEWPFIWIKYMNYIFSNTIKPS